MSRKPPLVYRISINEELLKSLFLHPISSITPREIREVEKVAEVIFNKYFRKYPNIKRDMKRAVILAVLTRHANFDPQFRAYNYIYTIARNEMGNYIKKVTKEQLADDLSADYDREYNDELLADCTEEVARWLAGEFDGAVMDIPLNYTYTLLFSIENVLCGRNGGCPVDNVKIQLEDCQLNF